MSNDKSPETFDEQLRALFEDAVADVEPRDALEEIRMRTRVTSIRSRRPWLWGAGAAVVATAATIAAIAVVGGDPSTTPAPGPAGSPTPAPTRAATPSPTEEPSPTPTEEPSPTPDSGEAQAAPVYYLGEVSFHAGEEGDMQTGFRLYREWHSVTGDDSLPVLSVRQMLQVEPLDPDYSSAWADGTDVASVTHEGGVIEVDLTGPVQEAQVGAETAELSVQQLVYTVQAALAVESGQSVSDPVRITVDGEPVAELWGHVDTSQPVARAPQIDVQAPVWIISPHEGETVAGPVTVDGVAAVFEANVNWRVLRDGAVVEEGFETASEGAPAFGTYEFTVELAPGEYTLEVFESSALDGSAIFVDTKQFTVEE